MKADDCKIIVALYLRGDDLDPDAVTEMLGVRPSRFQRKGERKTTSTNREYVVKTGMWGLISDCESFVLADHITDLASTLAVDWSGLKQIAGVTDAYVDIFLAATSDEEGESTYEFELSSENLSALERIGLPVRFTVSLGKE